MNPDQFLIALAQNEITAHVGYAESVILLASMFGITLDKVDEVQERWR